jgi:hypothetical protein
MAGAGHRIDFRITTVQIRHARVADSVADTFQPRYTPQQTPLATSQYYASPIYPPLDVPQTFANPMYRPMQIRNDERSGTSLSPGAIEKIQELKALMNKYPRYHTNPDGIIRLAVYNSINGDDTLLDDKLEQLRTIDSLAKY